MENKDGKCTNVQKSSQAISRSELLQGDVASFSGELNGITPPDLLRIAVSQNADLDKLEKLMDLQQCWEANEAKKAFTVAMAAFKVDGPAVLPKDSKVNFAGKNNGVSYTHASLGGICEKITPLLSKHGLSISFKVAQDDHGKITVACWIRHIGGHAEYVNLQGPPDSGAGKNALQAIGSTTTYLARYTMLLALGLATADINDDDGQSATSQPETLQRRPEPSPQAIEAYAALRQQAKNECEQGQQGQPDKPSHDQRVQRVVAKFKAKFGLIQSDIEHFLGGGEPNPPRAASQWTDEDFKILTEQHRELCKVPPGPDRIKAVCERFGLQSSAIEG